MNTDRTRTFCSIQIKRASDLVSEALTAVRLNWLRGHDLNVRPSGYEPDELPDCSTPRFDTTRLAALLQPHSRQEQLRVSGNWSTAFPIARTIPRSIPAKINLWIGYRRYQ